MQAVISGIILLAMLATVFNPFVCHSLLWCLCLQVWARVCLPKVRLY
jgi:hypothetical protein